MRRLLIVLLLLLAPSFARADKVALVIGNGAYRYSNSLPNAPNDAADMAQALAGIGFTVFGGIDLTQAETLQAVDDFSAALTPETLALFYYAGHGAQIGAENVVIPVDAAGGTAQDLMGSSVRLATILRTMELRADRRVVILDACRNNPFLAGDAARGGTPAPGLARVEAGVGSYIAFSTQPGNVALDGGGRNSPFTAALLSHIAEPGLDIHAVMRKVRADVVSATGQTQVPWENSSLVDQLFLAAAAEDEPAMAGAPPPGNTGNATQPLAFVPGQPGAAAPQPFAQPSPQPAAPAPVPAAPSADPFFTTAAPQPEPLAAPPGKNPFAAAPPPLPDPGNPFAGIDFGPEEDDGPAVGDKVGSMGGSFGRQPAAGAGRYVVSGLAAAGYGFLTLRGDPSPTGLPLGALEEGTPVEVMETSGDWVLVRADDGSQGWVAGQWIACCGN